VVSLYEKTEHYEEKYTEDDESDVYFYIIVHNDIQVYRLQPLQRVGSW